MSTRLTGREQRALTVIGLARGLATGNVVREISVQEALRIYEQILKVVRPEFEEASNVKADP